MALTGLPDAPLGPPEGLVEGVAHLGRHFPRMDTLALLGERAALMGLWRRGATSCGGSCRLFPCADDGFMAVSLPRDEDMEMIPAWLELDTTPASAPAMWSAVAASLRERDTDLLHQRAQLLGLPVAYVGEATHQGATPTRLGVLATRLGEAPPRPDLAGTLVIDLSALWAGPLCGDLLAGTGATVLKVESTQRPDGARRGARAFYDLLNGRKRSVALDLQTPRGVRILHALVRRADVAIEASRPRALAQFGLDAQDVVAAGGPQIWVSITGYGRSGEAAHRVAFGDDAAAAGALVTRTADGPLFCADAIADPLTGLTAAAACLDKLRSGGRWLLDISMAAVSAELAGPTLPVPAAGLTVTDPHARPVTKQAPELGADTARVLAELGIDG
jgi:hypothetical protein